MGPKTPILGVFVLKGVGLFGMFCSSCVDLAEVNGKTSAAPLKGVRG